MSKLTCMFEHKGEKVMFRHAVGMRSDGTTGTPYYLEYLDRKNALDPGVVLTLKLDRYDVENDVVHYRVANLQKIAEK